MLNRDCKGKMGLGRSDGVTRFVQVRDDNGSKQAEGCRVKTGAWILMTGCFMKVELAGFLIL